MRNWTFLVLLLWSIKYILGDCPGGSTNLIQICGPVTVTNKERYTIDFSSFESTPKNSCQCSFTATSDGDFNMAPHNFQELQGCGTRVSILVNGNTIQGGTGDCTRVPFLPATPKQGDTVAVKITSTTSSTRTAKYCYIATFPRNITFTCTTGDATAPTTTTTSTTTTTTNIAPTTTRSPITTSQSVVTASPTVTENSPTTKSGTLQTEPSTAKDEVPLTIVIPAAIGGVLVLLIIVIVAVVCSRRPKSAKSTAERGNENPNFSMEEHGNDGLKDNILYKSADNGGYSEIGDGHYSSVIRHSAEMNNSAKNTGQSSSSSGQNNSPSENNIASGPVYAVVDKNKSQNKKQGPPVSGKPSKNSQVLEIENVPVYAVPDKSQTKKGRSDDYDTPPNNRPITPPAQPVRTSNKDGLLYSEVQHTGIGPIPDLPKRKSDSTEQEGVTYSDIRTEL